MTRDAMKSAFKAKYEARLKAMKTEFETKFKKNEMTWRSRLDFHKQALTKEQMKNREYEQVIMELSEKVNEVEKKNREMHLFMTKHLSNGGVFSTAGTS